MPMFFSVGQVLCKDITLMTPQRSHAYGIALKTLRDLQAAKFTAEQMQCFVDCADAYLFADDAASAVVADELFLAAEAELDAIGDADRLMPETVARIKAELYAIRPPALARAA
jgi:hypothetical protein